LDHTKKELAQPIDVELNADGSITGGATGRWTIQEGTSYINITLSNLTYKGVMVEQTLEKTNNKAASFTAIAKSGVSIWGYYTGPTAGISNITNDARQDGPIYDLQGRRVNSTSQKGIYIRNGKKFIVH
jgi:arabinan endo-1,5-alpha-L-arabinosidase